MTEEKKTFAKKPSGEKKNRPHTNLKVKTDEIVIGEDGKEYQKTDYITGLWAYNSKNGPFLTGGDDKERFYINLTDEVFQALGYIKK
jgi:hypothetical protein